MPTEYNKCLECDSYKMLGSLSNDTLQLHSESISSTHSYLESKNAVFIRKTYRYFETTQHVPTI